MTDGLRWSTKRIEWTGLKSLHWAYIMLMMMLVVVVGFEEDIDDADVHFGSATDRYIIE